MGAAYLLCFCTHLFLFVQQSNGQPQKTPAEWDSRQAALFPNPLLNNSKCQVSIPMRICDPNTVLPSQPREESNNLLKGIEGLVIPGDSSEKKCLCNKNCLQPTVIMIVALMKCLSKDVHDPWVETKDIAQAFREQWKLDDCSVVLASASDNKRYNLNPGKAVVEFLTSNVTDYINNRVNETFMNGQLADGIEQTVSLYSQALNETTKETQQVTENPPTEASGVAITIVIIILIVVIVIVIIFAIVMAIRCTKRKQVIQKDLKENEPPSNKETKPLTGNASA